MNWFLSINHKIRLRGHWRSF